MSRIRFVPIGGFLGAGKTTTLIRAAQELHAHGERVAIVTNDQGEDLVDTRTVRAAVAGSVSEVTGGCFCCRFEDLAAVVEDLVRTSAPTVVLAEAVGSCTDLQSTVVRPLRSLLGDRLDVAPLVVVTDPERYLSLRGQFGVDGADATDLAHLYHHQLAEADVIALNKVDLLSVSAREELLPELARRFPGKQVVGYSAATGEGVEQLLAIWAGSSVDPVASQQQPFAVDYDRYAAAEADLAWTNQVYELTGPLVPDTWLAQALGHIAERIDPAMATVGHVKVRVATARGCARASLTAAGGRIRHDESDAVASPRATAWVNARVGTSPEQLAGIIQDAVAAANLSCASESVRVRGDVFRPGYPVPRFRM